MINTYIRIQLVVALVVLSSTVIAQPTDFQSREKLIEQGFEVPSLEVLVSSSEIVLMGDVLTGKSRWIGKKILTDWKVGVRDFYKGKPDKTIVVTTYGGQVDDIAQDFTHSAQLSAGSSVVLFLAPKSDQSLKLSENGYFVSYDEYGVVTLLRDGESKSRLRNNTGISQWLDSLKKEIDDIQ